MVVRTRSKNISTLMTLPTLTRWFCLSPKDIKCIELAVGNCHGSVPSSGSGLIETSGWGTDCPAMGAGTSCDTGPDTVLVIILPLIFTENGGTSSNIILC
jgi:hypothetical protein